MLIVERKVKVTIDENFQIHLLLTQMRRNR